MIVIKKIIKFLLYKIIFFGEKVYIKNTCSISMKSKLLAKNGEIYIDNDVWIDENSLIDAEKSKIKIGKNCRIHRLVTIKGGKYVEVNIGANVLIAEKVSIFASQHQFREKDILINNRSILSKGITIEDDVWIGGGTIVLDGIIIKKGCVIGAGSVVTKNTEEYGIYVGNPARKIGSRE
jgi:acetyltransferase-like isoleucine patch superfamily enzyme